VVLPRRVAIVGSVILLYRLVRPCFGTAAGLLAGRVLAVTPVAIAVERDNTPDATLIFTLLLVTWAFIKATVTRRLRFLLQGAVLFGIGFNIKMLQDFLPFPAQYAMYFFGSQQSWRRKLIHLTMATFLLATVSHSWAVAVDLTPADQRRYVSSTTNSELNLIFGYNGLQRLLGRFGQGTGANRGSGATTLPLTAAAQTGSQTDTQTGTQPPAGCRPDSGQGDGSISSGMFGTGQAGALRLFQSGLAALVSWLLPFGLIMLVAMAVSRSWHRPHTEPHRGLMLWGGWLVTPAACFSVAGFFHQYYLSTLRAPLAALVAVGMVFLWRPHATHPIRAARLLLGAADVTFPFNCTASPCTNPAVGGLRWPLL
jgi:4-amino-4-deoxy-L-arabinose transferase-like glycosyltransferase